MRPVLNGEGQKTGTFEGSAGGRSWRRTRSSPAGGSRAQRPSDPVLLAATLASISHGDTRGCWGPLIEGVNDLERGAVRGSRQSRAM